MPVSKGNLGNTLSKQFKSARRSRGGHGSSDANNVENMTTCLSPPPPQTDSSVTQQGDLAEFLSRAELLNAKFDSSGGPGAGSLRLLSREEAVAGSGGGAGVLAKAARERRRQAAEELRNQLRIPRRPAWSPGATGPAELEALERESFLRWREAMAILEAKDGVTMTPFEKNLDFWRQLWRVLERSRAVVQIVDARDPLFFYSADLDAYAKECGCCTAVLLNKCDLLTPLQLTTWRRYFQNEGIRALFFSAKPAGADADEDVQDRAQAEAEKAAAGAEAEGTDESPPPKVLSPDGLAEALANLAAEAASTSSGSTVPTPVVGLVGYPNVGKSSSINAMLRAKKVPESATPGRTKHLQTLPLGDRLVLCDCPGLVMPQFVGTAADLVVHGVLPIDTMRDCLGPVQLLCDRIDRQLLAQVYGLRLPNPPEPLTAAGLLTAYAELHGYTTGHGVPHLDRAAREILKDCVTGRRRALVHCQAPPGFQQIAGVDFTSGQELLPTTAEEAAGTDTAMPAEGALTDFDRQFFTEKTADVRFRTTGRPPQAQSDAEQTSKSWKRHNNSGKREKLRRVYRHLDQ